MLVVFRTLLSYVIIKNLGSISTILTMGRLLLSRWMPGHLLLLDAYLRVACASIEKVLIIGFVVLFVKATRLLAARSVVDSLRLKVWVRRDHGALLWHELVIFVELDHTVLVVSWSEELSGLDSIRSYLIRRVFRLLVILWTGLADLRLGGVAHIFDFVRWVIMDSCWARAFAHELLLLRVKHC